MTSDNHRDADGAGFPTTRWSVVHRAGEQTIDRAALGLIVERYHPALLAHLRWQWRLRPADAEEMLQAFVADKLVEDNLCAAANRERGRFRTFLRTALDNFTASRMRANNAQKRLAVEATITMDQAGELGSGRTNPDAFEAEWGRQVIAEALQRTHEHLSQTGKSRVSTLFERMIVTPLLRDSDKPNLADVAQELGFESVQQASNALVTAKRAFARSLDSIAAAYSVSEGPQELLRDLRQILGSNGAS